MNKSNMSWQNAGKVVSRQTKDSMREIVHATQFLAAQFYKMNKSNELANSVKVVADTGRNAMQFLTASAASSSSSCCSSSAASSSQITVRLQPEHSVHCQTLFTALDFADLLNDVDSDLIIQHDTNI